MRGIIILLLVLAGFSSAFAQKEEKIKSKRLTKVESAKMTREQRLVHESERKSKKNKPMSMQKKVKMEKKQIKSAKRTKSPSPRKRKKN